MFDTTGRQISVDLITPFIVIHENGEDTIRPRLFIDQVKALAQQRGVYEKVEKDLQIYEVNAPLAAKAREEEIKAELKKYGM